MKKVVSVEFALENCEVLPINGEYIGNFRVNNIKRKVYKHYNSIIHMEVCDDFAIAVSKEANKDYYVFNTQDEDWKNNTFERLSSGDICSVKINYDDETNDDFYVDWVGESSFINEAQKSYISKLGDLYIVVSKTETVDSVFGSWEIDDEKGHSSWMFR